MTLTAIRLDLGLGNGHFPAKYYIDPAYFERERERLFRRVWLMVGREEEVPGVGDYIIHENPTLRASVIIVRGKDRDEAISRMTRALDMFIVEGIYTTIPLHRRILADADFRAGTFDTGFIERFLITKKAEPAA